MKSNTKYLLSNEKPTSIKLGELKPNLQAEAFEKERSLHWLIKKVLLCYSKLPKEKRELFLKTMMQS